MTLEGGETAAAGIESTRIGRINTVALETSGGGGHTNNPTRYPCRIEGRPFKRTHSYRFTWFLMEMLDGNPPPQANHSELINRAK